MALKKIASTLAAFVLGNFGFATAQSVRYPLAMPYLTSGAYSRQQAGVFSFTGNQAALAQVKQAGAGVYGERRFLLAEINAYAAAVALPSKLGNFGLSVNYSGFKDFNESRIGLAYARGIGNKVDIGIQFNYYGYRIPAYAGASAINVEGGIIMRLTNKLQGGVHVYNPAGGKLGKAGNEKLAAAFKTGLGYDASDDLFVSAEMVKEEDKPFSVTASIQYSFAKSLFARGGFLTGSAIAFAGIGAGWKNLRIDISGSYHPQLGLTPGILLMTSFGKKGA